MKALAFAAVLATAAAAPSVAAADVFVFNAILTGANEVPPTGSPGTGQAIVIWDTTSHLVNVRATFSGLTSGTTASHIHAPIPTTASNATILPVATQLPSFIGFPLGVTSGTFDNTFATNSSTFYNVNGYLNPWGGVGNAESALLNSLLTGRNYYNIHTVNFPGGEIRGALTLVPEPGAWALMIFGFGAAGSMLRRRRALALA
jgi:hypothetical protein